jgi:outer membrane protein
VPVRRNTHVALTLAGLLLSVRANAQAAGLTPPPPSTGSLAITPAPEPDGRPGPTPVPTTGAATNPPPPSPQEAVSGDQPAGPVTLDAAVELALSRNHEVIAASLNALEAQQSYLATRGTILPNLNFNASIGPVRIGGGEVIGTFVNPTTGQTVTQVNSSQSYWNHSAGLSLSQLIFDGGAWWNNLDAAKLTFKSLQETSDEQKLQTTYQVTQAFLELVRAQKQLAVFGESARRSRDQADFEEKLYNAGKVAQSDVYAARSNRDNDEVNRLSSEALVEQSRYALAVLLGLDSTFPITVVEPAELKDLPPAPPTPANAVQTALASRPSLRAFEHALEATRKATSGLKGRYYPSLSFNAAYQRGSRVFPDIVSNPAEKNTLSASLNLNWNLFNGLADRANVRKSELLELNNENDLAHGKRQVASDVQTAIANLSGARQRAQVAGQSEATAQEGLRLAKARQTVGVGTELDVRDAELKLTQAQLAHVNALVDGREQLAALKRAMGSDPSALGTPAQPNGDAQRNIGG